MQDTRAKTTAVVALLLASATTACADETGTPAHADATAATSPRDASGSGAAPESADTRELYLELMKVSLLDLVYETNPNRRAKRQNGSDFGGRGMTMIGRKRLDNLHELGQSVLDAGVPGDFIEAGAWRGGATIFMRALLAANGDGQRMVWVADSFEGLPPPDPKNFPADKGAKFHELDFLSVSLKNVQRNFARYELLDGQVKFLEGWFKDTLPEAPIERLALLRIDGDLYESTMQALQYLYPKLSPGGYVIVDDYGCIDKAEKATDDYRSKHGIDAKVHVIDWCGVYWQKPRD